jgi:hypothetical protein
MLKSKAVNGLPEPKKGGGGTLVFGTNDPKELNRSCMDTAMQRVD